MFEDGQSYLGGNNSSTCNRSSMDYTKPRKSQSDFPPSSPTTVKNLRHERSSRSDSSGLGLTTSESASDRAAARSNAYTEQRAIRLALLNSKTDDESRKDFKKLYETAYNENEKLKSNLREAQLELADIKSKLERVVKVE